jgi:hypothetical protein
MRKVVTRKRREVAKAECPKRPKIGDWITPKKTAPAKLQTPSPAPLITTNQFSGLKPVGTVGGIKTRIPPIIMAASTHQTLVNNIKSFGVLDFNLKYTGNQNVAIFAKSLEDHEKIKKGLAVNNKEFHSYTPKDNIIKKSVIKGLPANMDVEDIKEDLQQQGLPVAKVVAMKTQRPLYLVTYESAPKTELLKMIRCVCLVHITIEIYRTKGKITQCFRCQQYGHASRNCNRMPRCVKCPKNHDTKDCERKDRTTPATCTGCGGAHPANFKECPRRQEYLKMLEKRRNTGNPWTTKRGGEAQPIFSKEDFPSLPKTASIFPPSPPPPRETDAAGDLISTGELYKLLKVLQEVRLQASRCSNKMELALLLVSRLDDFE